MRTAARKNTLIGRFVFGPSVLILLSLLVVPTKTEVETTYYSGNTELLQMALALKLLPDFIP